MLVYYHTYPIELFVHYILQRNLFLVALKKDLDLDLKLDSLNIPQATNDELKDFYKGLEFNSFIEDKVVEKVSKNYSSIKNLKQLREIEKELDDSKCFAFDTETTSLLAHEAEMVGFSFALKENTGVYVPIRHNEQTDLDADETTKWLKAVLERNQEKII